MKKPLLLTLLLTLSLASGAWGERLVEEGFEEATGYSMGAAFWTEIDTDGAGGASIIDVDYTGVASHTGGGSQCFRSQTTDATAVEASIYTEFSSIVYPCYLRFWIYVATPPGDGKRKDCAGILTASEGARLCQFAVVNTGGVLTFTVNTYDAGFSDSATILEDTWYLVELHYSYDYYENDTGAVEWWIDGVSQGSGTVTSSNQPFRVTVGCFLAGVANRTIADILFDSVTVDDERIGNQFWSKERLQPGSDVGSPAWSIEPSGDTYAVLGDDDNDTYIHETTLDDAAQVAFPAPEWMGVPVGLRFGVTHAANDRGYCGTRVYPLLEDGSTPTSQLGGFEVVWLYSQTDWEDTFVQVDTDTWNADIALDWDRFIGGSAKELRSEIKLVDEGDAEGKVEAGKVSEAWIDVIRATNNNPLLIAGPKVGAVTSSAAKIMVGLNGAAEVTIRYSTSKSTIESGGGTASTPVSIAQQAGRYTAVATFYSGFVNLSELTADTEYYYDVLIDGSSVYQFENSDPANAAWSDPPRFRTAPEDDVDSDYSFVVCSDRHFINTTVDNFDCYPNVYKSIAALDPTFVAYLGDFHYQSVASAYYALHGLKATLSTGWPGYRWGDSIDHNFATWHTWSDHDFGYGNGCKVYGINSWGDSISSFLGDVNYEVYEVTKSFLPFPASVGDFITGTATQGSSDGNTLVDDEGDFSAVFPGMMVYSVGIDWDGAWGIVTAVNSSTSIETTTMSAGYEWNAEADVQYLIRDKTLYHTFKWGNVEFFVLDLRSKRDPNKTPGGDIMDGMRFYGNTLSIGAKATGTADATTTATSLVDAAVDFSAAGVVVGDVVCADLATDTFSLVTQVATNTLTLSSSGCDNSGTATTGAAGLTTGTTYYVYESGGSDHGDSAANIAAGHVQRDTFINDVNTSTAKWKIVLAECPAKWDDSKDQGESIADHDPLDGLYSYLKANIAEDIIWFGGDRHFLAFDDGSHANDPWPSVQVGAVGNTVYQPVWSIWEYRNFNTVLGKCLTDDKPCTYSDSQPEFPVFVKVDVAADSIHFIGYNGNTGSPLGFKYQLHEPPKGCFQPWMLEIIQ